MMDRRTGTGTPGARPRMRAARAMALISGMLVLASPLAHGQNSALSQTPLFVSQSLPPLNMLVMGRDHKLYYEAYNDASDLNGDGVIDVGYKPDQIDYYGYFNNNACYTYASGVFKIAAAAVGDRKKKCAGNTYWSGDYLNYVGTSRMDAIRRVLYGGMRVEDTASRTVLQAAYIPRDAHTWGKAYDPVRDGSVYAIEDYTPLRQPKPGTRHLLVVTTLGEQADTIPQLRVLNDSLFQIWDWISQEGPAGQANCAGSGSCAVGQETQEYRMLLAPSFRNLSIATYRYSGAIPSSQAGMDQLFNAWTNPSALCGTGGLSVINTEGSNNNPFAGSNGCSHESYLTLIKGQVYVPQPGSYRFALDGDDAVDATIGGSTWGWYGGHGSSRSQGALESHAQTIYFSSAGWKDLVFRHVEGTGGDSWGLALRMVRPVSAITSYGLRVEACASSSPQLREASCKAYPNNGGKPVHKPTGLLHDFGESGKMYFGLLTGSYEKNIAGGVVRRNIGSFMDELDAQTGQFKAGVNGVVANIDRQRLIGYNGSNYSLCGWIDSAPLSAQGNPSICAMWGNPIGEMMFEAMRYFSGASAALATYDYGSGNGTKDAGLGLSKPAWSSPYKDAASGGGGHQRCSRPVMTVISDINPSYDGKMPGSRYGNINASASGLGGFNVATETNAIGMAEGISGQPFFIGQSTSGNADQAPSVKTIADLSWARGLSPQEPSKEGTYYSAGVARFGANNAVFGQNALMTYSVAIASPLPEIRFPVGAGNGGDRRYVTIVPFAKSVIGGSIDSGRFAPTNQIVDYYVDRIANTGAADQDAAVNEGRPYAEFRINYEDMEQGADHDMDAIARYVVSLQADGKVRIEMFSEYGVSGNGQHMGYVVSGTTRDGMYLEVRDKDTNSVYYAYNTPPGRDPGYCVNASGERRNECSQLALTASRTFTPSSAATSGSFLKNPLWYAAKYGIPQRDPGAVKGDPDNYFLVTNASTLKDQLTSAFNSIVQNTASVTAVSVDMPTANLANGADLYRTSFDAEHWSGDVLRESLQAGSKTLQWSAAQKLSEQSADDRNIYYAGRNASGVVLRPFTVSGLGGQAADADWLAALDRNPITGVADGQARQRLAFLRGQADDGLRKRKLLPNGRPNVLGDIVNASLVRVKGPLYQAAAADRLEGSGSDYAAFARAQAGKPEMLYVGANDGMLHAFNAATGAEAFAFIPSGVKDSLGLLTSPGYGAKGGLPHRYFVDGNSFVSDVYFDNAWHRVLIGSLGAGGRQIFALDISDPAAPTLLWEFGDQQHANMGYSVPKPSIARLNDAGTAKGKWVVLLPNGYEANNSRAGGASLFVLDVSNGSVIRQFDLEGAMTAQELTASLPLGNGLSRLAAIDNNTDGKVDLAYAGDLAGNVWRLDLSSGSSADWSAKRFFTARDAAGRRQSITAAPYVVRHPTGKGDLVIFGTGRFMSDTDKLNQDTQTLYGVWDRHSGPGATTPGTLPSASKNRSHLQGQVFTELDDYPGKFWLSANTVQWYAGTAGTTDADVNRWGWYVNLPRNGERLIYDPSLYGRGLLFTSIRTSQDICDGGMNSALYDIDPNTGGQLKFVAFDVKKDGFFNAADNLGGRQISGYEVGAGKQTVSGGIIFNPDGQKAVAQEDSGGGINHGVDVGRQSWRRQPAN